MNDWDQWLTDEAVRRDAAGLTRRLRPRGPDDDVIDLAGNDYLGLSRDPLVVAAAVEAARVWGAGAGASRLVTGTLALHETLEQELASFLGQPAALAMSTGYHANPAAVTALADRDTLIVSDAHIHASLIDAARLSRAEIAVTPHGDVDAVAAALAGADGRRAIVLAESIYSVLGDAAPLTDLGVRLRPVRRTADRRRGPRARRGRRDRRRARPRPRPRRGPHVVVTATLSKSLGARGRRGPRLPRPRPPPGQPGPAVHLRHGPQPGRHRRCPRGPAGAALAARAAGSDPLPRVVPGRTARRRRPGGRRTLRADGVSAGRDRGAGRVPRSRRAGRLLPATVGAGRHLPAAHHHQRGRAGRRVGPRV
ncbi:aminotransferase class I/II-fold pyridoxal phosphate-dependent enzyme [Nocardioides sp. B-3]|nr:aminotransferase class I/II-fold pyridoxal phosphate-dependent enzyme [Nocardioides sp. B-3]UUZ59944.1 aminotransferase class I/II-fold pyridoxal phosphate-dependent enzyme [Nocardioides sp. B-3]